MAKYGLMGLLGIPILALIYVSLKLLFGMKGNSGIGIAVTVLWIISLLTCAVVGLQIGSQFTAESSVTEKIPINASYPTLLLKADIEIMPGKHIASWNQGQFLSFDDEYIYRGMPLLDIIKSDDDSLRLRVIKKCHGNSKKEALDRAAAISYHLAQNNEQLVFDAFYSFDLVDKLRGQEVELILEVPIGMAVFFDSSLDDVIYDIHNVTDTYDSKMLGKTWVMTAAGLSCVDCGGSLQE
jgi:hypothetical protein